METALLLAQTVATGAIASWLTLGVRDNLLYPSMNETYTAEVMNMTRMREEYPDEFAEVAHRAISDRKIQKAAFVGVILVEVFALVLLWVGTVALLMATIGAAQAETGRIIALYGATVFLAIWSAFLVVGNHFVYWFCHEGAQNTHYQMTLWGLGTLILLSQS